MIVYDFELMFIASRYRIYIIGSNWSTYALGTYARVTYMYLLNLSLYRFSSH